MITKTADRLRLRRFTRAEYYRLGELGLFLHQRVELIDGVIVLMSPKKPPHSIALHLTEEELRSAFGVGFWVRNQEPLHIGRRSAPEPDVAVVAGDPRSYQAHPRTALLVVEISDTTLSYDRNRKGSLYARGGIQDYWIVNLVSRQLEIHRNPGRDPSKRYGYGFYDTVALTANDFAIPLAAPHARIAVANLLP